MHSNDIPPPAQTPDILPEPPSSPSSKFEVQCSTSDVQGSKFDVQGSASDVHGSASDAHGSKFEVQGSTSDVQGSTSDVQGSTSDVQGSTSDVQGSKFDVQGSKFDVQGSTFAVQSSTPHTSRGNGKIARLPKATRDQVNQWILDGVSYSDIIQRLGDQAPDLNPGHLSEWKKRGHQDWLLEQSWLAQTRIRQEPASDLAADFDATHVSHAALQLGTLQIFDALRSLAADPMQPRQSPRSKSLLDLTLGGDSAAFVRLINALSRASRETMLVQKYRDACSQARAALQELKDPHRKLNESETRAIVLKVDNILGLRSTEEKI